MTETVELKPCSSGQGATMNKLTKAQAELLRTLPTNCVDYYQPRKKLIEMGLATAGAGDSLLITPAGRAALTSNQEGNDEA